MEHILEHAFKLINGCEEVYFYIIFPHVTAHILQNWKDKRCPQPSSAGFHAWRSEWACGSQGRSGTAGSRCPSWSTDLLHPGPRCRNGRHIPAAQTLPTQNSCYCILHQGFVFLGCDGESFTFSVSKICCVQLHNTICKGDVVKDDLQFVVMTIELHTHTHTLWITYQLGPLCQCGPRVLSFQGRESARRQKQNRSVFQTLLTVSRTFYKRR